MKQSVFFGFILLIAFLMAGVADALETNFQPANTAQGVRVSNPTGSETASQEPKEKGFWQKEAERSGFAQTFDGFQGLGGTLKSFVTGQWFKEQEEAYLKRKQGQ